MPAALLQSPSCAKSCTSPCRARQDVSRDDSYIRLGYLEGSDLNMVAQVYILHCGGPTAEFGVMQALGLNGEDYDDATPVVTGSQISSHALEEALKSVPEDAAQR